VVRRAPGVPDIQQRDAELNLLAEGSRTGLRRLAAAESARGSFEEAATAALIRVTGVKTGESAFDAGLRPGPFPGHTASLRRAPWRLPGPNVRLQTTASF
jgi:hypothetical protein